MQPTNGFAWFLAALEKYAVFSGRARRREFWYFCLFQTIFGMIVKALEAVLATQIVSLIYSLAIFAPTLAVSVRRLHDTDRSGWWCLLPLINLVFLCRGSDPGVNRFGLPPYRV